MRLFSHLALLTSSGTLLALAAPLLRSRQDAPPSGLTTSAEAVDGKWYDYVIVGGGLAGLALAGRLSEDEDVSVLVLEAGNDDRTDERVYDISNYGKFYGTSLDWAWDTTSGKRIGGGKTLGGSSSINGGHYTRGEAAQYDAWQTLLGNDSTSEGWNWEGMLAAMKKSENFFEPNEVQRAAGADFVSDYHGTSGPLQVTFPRSMYAGPGQPSFVETLSSSFGVPYSPDLNGGNASVVAYTLSMLNPDSNYERASSATTYFGPVENVRTNLLVLTGHQATALVTDTSSGSVVVSAVRFQADRDGPSFSVTVKREAILSAGSIASPALLQQSGIGPASVLKKAGVEVVLDLPGVGRNLNEQTSTVSGFTPKEGVEFGGGGPSDCIAFPGFDVLFAGQDTEAIKQKLADAIPTYATEAFEAGGVVSVEAGQRLFDLQRKLIVESQVGLFEAFFDSGYPNGGFGIDSWNLLPFARGSVEITSANAFDRPKVDPRYFAADFDMRVQIAGMRFGRQAFKTSPLADIVSGENQPGYELVPDSSSGGSDEDWASWINETFGSVSHPISTCALMSRELGGVVDGHMKVYGTSNLRVVDASVLPMQVSAHLSATVYGLAEQAADRIKAARMGVTA